MEDSFLLTLGPFIPDEYDKGYSSVGESLKGKSILLLNYGWLFSQLQINPKDKFKLGRFDAVCDKLINFGPFFHTDPFQGLIGSWRKID